MHSAIKLSLFAALAGISLDSCVVAPVGPPPVVGVGVGPVGVGLGYYSALPVGYVGDAYFYGGRYYYGGYYRGGHYYWHGRTFHGGRHGHYGHR